MDDRSFADVRGAGAAPRFGRELRRRRTQAGLTQRQLADRVRYSREMVAAVERGRRYGSHELAVRCDEVLVTGGALARLWPMVESEQVAADRRRGPRTESTGRRGPRGSGAAPAPAVVRAARDLARPAADLTGAGWADWAERIRPAIDDVPPELAVQLRDLINNLVLASARETG
jgi:DNA-binding XRE family transcriptional regulator